VGLAPTGKRRLFTAHAESSHSGETALDHQVAGIGAYVAANRPTNRRSYSLLQFLGQQRVIDWDRLGHRVPWARVS
jgi:hypothetical protein